ncbi:MAG TPA: ABC transporter permease [Gemmatimonadales bacterium]|nr:ABC transporter permease [Gemmatimonadales bacterium]
MGRGAPLWLARLLLALYPSAFRRDFGADVLQVFADAWRPPGGGIRRIPARAMLLADLLRGAVIQRLEGRTEARLVAAQSTAHSRLTMRDLLSEFRHAIRSLARTPGFTLAVVLTLALGIGANSAIFSVVDGVLLRPAPFRDMDQLVMVWESDRKSGTVREPASVPDYFDFKERSKRFEQLAAFSPITATLEFDAGDEVRVPGLWVTHEFLPMVGIQPIAGTTFTADQDQPDAPLVALISDALWAERFARSPAAIGSTIRISESPVTVIGVLPASADFGTLQILGVADYRRSFADQGGRARVDFWMTLRGRHEAQRGNHPIFMAGRLSRGVSAALGQEEMGSIAAELERTYPQSNDGRGAHVEPLAEVVFGGVRPALLVLVGAVALVLLVACANVANLLLARGAARAREVSVRAALGASVSRLTRQFLIESALLTAVGAAVGLILALVGLQALLALAPGSIPRVGAVGIDARVLGATVSLALLISVTFGLVPAIQARRRGPSLALQSESGRGASAGREQRRFRSGLVVAELALAVILMVGAGLLIKSLWRLHQVDPGFNAAGILKADFELPGSGYPQSMRNWPQWPEIRRFAAEVRQRIAALPGVTDVAMASAHPLEAGYTSSIVVVGREAEAADWPEPAIRIIDAGYLKTMRVSLVAGRAMTDADDLAAPPVIAINQAARRVFFGNQDPLGQKVQLWGQARMVVGVLADERVHGLAAAAPPAIYLPTSQAPVPNGSLLIRVAGDPVAFAPALRAAVRQVDAGVSLLGVEPLSTTLSQSTAQRRFTMLVLGIFAAVALLLAMIGVHGVLSYTVAQRTREIGIRMALGADTRSVRSLVLGQGARMVATGLLIGVAGAFAGARGLSTLLYGVAPHDPLTFVAVAVALGGVALVASWLPARRAMRVDPVVALRME